MMSKQTLENNRESPERIPIDSGGVIQFLTGIKEQTPVLILEYTVKEPVDREKLRSATEKALTIFRVFRVKLSRGGPDGRPVYLINTSAPDVYPYDGLPHAFGSESNGYLFRIYYRENKILLSMHHMLTDGFGAHAFLDCILNFYFDVEGGDPEKIREKLPVDPDDLRDPYALCGNLDSPDLRMKNKWQNELIIPNEMHYRKGEPVRVHQLTFSISDFIKTAKGAETSVFPLLTLLMGKAVARHYEGEDKILTGAGTFNCREMFQSRTARSFSQTFLTVLHPREHHMDRNMQLTVQHSRMIIELEKGTVGRTIAERKRKADLMMENPERYILDQERLDTERRAVACKSAYFLSYIGHMKVEKSLEPYVVAIEDTGTVTRVPVAAIVYEWKGILNFKTLEIGCRKSIAPVILEIADEYGLHGQLMTSIDQLYDYYPMEELYHG